MQQVQNFGEPFFLVIHEGETLEEIKSRIQKKLRVPDEDFAKVCKSLLTLIVIIATGMLRSIVINGGKVGLLLIRFFFILSISPSGSLLLSQWDVRTTCRTQMSFMIAFR